MLRSQKQTSSTPTESTTSLGLSSFHERHRLLEEEHQWLLKQIKRKRTELKNFLDQMRTIATRIFSQASPLYQKQNQLDTKIHHLFEEILTHRKLGKKSKQDILNVYHSLQLIGLVSPKFDNDEEFDPFFKDSSSERGNTETGENFFNNNAHNFNQFNEDIYSTESQTKSPESQQIRQTFLKLASLFHPDKVMDAETQMYYNEVMKEINRAYQEGDIARLLEIEKQHHLQEEIDSSSSTKSEIERLCLRREKDNQLLKNQYQNLKKELRIARNTPEGKLVKDYRACQKQGIDAVAEIVLELESQVKAIENIYNFVRDFRDKKITIKEFIKGPSRPENAEETLEMMFSRLFEIELELE